MKKTLLLVGTIENQKSLIEQTDLTIKGYGDFVQTLPFNISNEDLFSEIDLYPDSPVMLFSASCSKTKDIVNHFLSISRSLNLLFIVEPYTCDNQPAGPLVKDIIEDSIEMGLPTQNIFNGGTECTGSNLSSSKKIDRPNHFDALTVVGEIINETLNPEAEEPDLITQEPVKINKPQTPTKGLSCVFRPIKRTNSGNPIIIDETFTPFIPEDTERRGIKDEISDADFWTLLTIVIRENNNTELQGFADVAQVIYNRFGISTSGLGFYSGYSPGAPNNKTNPTPNLKALILSPGQFEPAFTAPGNGQPSEPWKNIRDFDTAVQAVMFNKNDPSKPRYTIEKAKEILLTAYNVLSDPNYQESAKQVIGGRTDFKAPNMYEIIDSPIYNCGSQIKCGIPSKSLSEQKRKEIENNERGFFIERKGVRPNNAFGWAWDYKGTEVYELNINWGKYKNSFNSIT